MSYGNVITYGRYRQSDDASAGPEPIEWIVLDYDAQKKQALLISKYGLEARQYHHDTPYPTWEKSDVRAWLNGDFLNAAFTQEEQKAIQTVKICTPPYNGNSGGNDTQDKIWLLSRDEAEKYFKSDDDRMAEATQYAESTGAYTLSSGCCWWWLRSPGSDGDCAFDVNFNGFLDYDDVDYTGGVVRPAFVLNLGSERSKSDGTGIAHAGAKGEGASTRENMRAQEERTKREADERARNASKLSVSERGTGGGKPVSQPAKAAASVKVGDVITYGRYRQSDDASAGPEPIEWIVLDYDKQKNQALLISKYGLEARQYHHDTPYPTWEKSDVRAWLNGDFLNAAFTAEEQKCIQTVKLSTPSDYGKRGGNDTQDKIWLLSRDEAKKYFKSDDDRMAKATQYAESTGAFTISSVCCWWWLRSPGSSSNCASLVDIDGSLGFYRILSTDVVVRPAFVLNLASAPIS